MNDIEKVARRMCLALGDDPDRVLSDKSYYPDHMTIPRWWLEREWAVRAIAAHNVLSTEWSSTSGRPPSSEAD